MELSKNSPNKPHTTIVLDERGLARAAFAAPGISALIEAFVTPSQARTFEYPPLQRAAATQEEAARLTEDDFALRRPLNELEAARFHELFGYYPVGASGV